METPNLSYIKNLSGGDLDFEEKIINIIKLEFAEEKKAYALSIENKDCKICAEIIHKLKHKISILGFEKSYEIAVDFERDLLKGEMKLENDFKEVLTKMTNYVNQL